MLPGLRRFGFDAVGVGTVSALHKRLDEVPADVLLLDVGLPDGDGFSVARLMRAQHPQLRVVMLTSRMETRDRVRGLSEGADAYLTKPVELDLLAATLHSLLRRVPSTEEPARKGWRLGADGWCLFSPGGTSTALTKSERSLCERLFANAGQLVSREALIGALTEHVYDFDAHRLDSMIHRLRTKAQRRCGAVLPLASVHGRGYVLTPGG
ncbi:response regulator transcription factor [Xanthomonas arboricola]|uniref:response regulator transcription factor n=1 Tax=Xanthomonas arboricola TaxID=56448 RepID=UPI001F0ACE4F|nr:response regulator transcription factor [Xanthomonas arboricola]